MSKRYREVLQEVETRRTRARADTTTDQATALGSQAEVSETQAEAPGGRAESMMGQTHGTGNDVALGQSAGGSTSTDPMAVGGPADSSGGVATLVRSVVRAPSRPPSGAAAPVASSVGTSASSRPGRSGHPGNGPVDADQPLVFAWRGRRYDVTRILGHWREEEGWWRRPDGEPIRIEQSDLWRVEAVRGGGMARDQRGVYELSHRGPVWRLDRVWD